MFRLFGICALAERDGELVTYVSGGSNGAEIGYSQAQPEAFAVHWTIKSLHSYLLGIQF